MTTVSGLWPQWRQGPRCRWLWYRPTRTMPTAAVLAALLMLMALLTVVAAADWKVAQTSGKVFIQQKGVQLVSLSKGGSLKAGSVIVTERNGRVKLVRGDQTMIVSPRSMVTLPADRGGKTRILEGQSFKRQSRAACRLLI